MELHGDFSLLSVLNLVLNVVRVEQDLGNGIPIACVAALALRLGRFGFLVGDLSLGEEVVVQPSMTLCGCDKSDRTMAMGVVVTWSTV